MALHDTRLSTYLNDHLGGATGGLELAKRAAGSNAEGDLGPLLERLATDFDEDRETLREIIGALGFKEDAIKKAAGWSAEKVGRLKPNGQLTGYSPLSRLIELEGLVIGITGKRSLWRSLATVKADDQRLAAFDFAALETRAQAELDDLEPHRVAAAAGALRD